MPKLCIICVREVVAFVFLRRSMGSSIANQSRSLVQPVSPGESRLGKLSESEAANQVRTSKLFVEYRDAFEAATGLPLDLVSLPGSEAVELAFGAAPGIFCGRMGDRAGACPACNEWRTQWSRSVPSEVVHFETKTGHTFTSIPIKADARLIGHFHTGHVFLRQPSKRRIAAHGGSVGSNANTEGDNELMRSSFLQTRVMSRVEYDACIRLLSHFAMHLSGICNQLFVNHVLDEPESVRVARGYIEKHKHRELAFTEVAAAVHLSAFHFCKVFRKATGLTFGHYLSLMRIEDAKLKLQNQHTRISEAAFAVGFQSIAQFNRTFRRFTGESPTEYRRAFYRAGSAVS